MTQWGLDVLFNPAKRHMDDEKQRLQSTREEVGDASKGSRIDLNSGKVVIRRKSATEAEMEQPAPATATPEATATSEADESAESAESAGPAESMDKSEA